MSGKNTVRKYGNSRMRRYKDLWSCVGRGREK